MCDINQQKVKATQVATPQTQNRLQTTTTRRSCSISSSNTPSGKTLTNDSRNLQYNTNTVATAKLSSAQIRTRRKPTRKAANSAVNAPIKGAPLEEETYAQLFNLKAANYQFEIERNIKFIQASPRNNTLEHSDFNLKRSRSFILSSCLASDKYDPFISAKRQLEELCSPTTHTNNTPLSCSTPTTPIVVVPAQSHKNMTTSLTLSSSTPNSSIYSRQTPVKNNISTPNSNFRRTSSLRGPRRSPLLPPRPLFVQNYRSTIQRGLSDEGPISTNFLKPEEYDEMPVRSVCVNDYALTKSPRVLRRDINATTNRKQSLKLNLTNNNEPAEKQPLKTDSLAVFLNYERELENLSQEKEQTNDSIIVAKGLKDKNNAKNLTIETPETIKSEVDVDSIEKPSLVRKLSVNENPHLITLPPLQMKPQILNLNSISVDNSKKNSIKEHNNCASSIENIDPKLINKCDNLPLHQLKQFHTNKKTEENLKQCLALTQLNSLPLPHTFTQQEPQPINEQRNLLKRKMRLDRNQFLYDASPEEKATEMKVESTTSNSNANVPHMPLLDDFDFEEFLSSFEQDDEQLPLFKDCKEFLMNRSSTKHRATSTPKSTYTTTSNKPLQFPQISVLHTAFTPNFFEFHRPEDSINETKTQIDAKDKREIFISIETEQSDSAHSPFSPSSLCSMMGSGTQALLEVDEVGAGGDGKFSKISDDDYDSTNIESVEQRLPNVQLNNAKNLIHNQYRKLTEQGGNISPKTLVNSDTQVVFQRKKLGNHFAYKRNNGFPENYIAADDSNEINSLDSSKSHNSRREVGAKTSFDSAYGSLSCQRSTEFPTPLPRNSSVTRPTTATLPDSTLFDQQQPNLKYKSHKTRCNNNHFKGSSSGSCSDTSLPPIDNYQLQKNTSNNNNNNKSRYTTTITNNQTPNRSNYASSNIERDLYTSNNNNNNNNSNSKINLLQQGINEGSNTSLATTTMGINAKNNNSNLNVFSSMSSSASSNPSMTSSACLRMSKFCHECGSKFIIDQAKFCMDCGVKRIIL